MHTYAKMMHNAVNVLFLSSSCAHNEPCLFPYWEGLYGVRHFDFNDKGSFSGLEMTVKMYFHRILL